MSEEKSTRERIFEFVIRYKGEHDGGAPSLREIARASCVTVSTVHYHLLKLELEGRIRMSSDRKGNIAVVGASWTYADRGSESGEHNADGDDQPDSAYSRAT